jgi:hypothetical protein
VRIEHETSFYKFPSIYTALANPSTPVRAGSFIIYGLLDMMLVTCETLEGEFACLCRALTCGRHFVKAQGHLDLHLELEAHRMDDVPLLLGHLDPRRCLWRHLGIPYM